MKNINKLIPNKLNLGDQIALISPSFKVTRQEVQFSIERIKALGLEPMVASSVLEQDGCYAGTIESRANELNNAFLDPKIKAIIAVRGGAGSAQLLEYINYDNIKNNPKILLGSSDITALLISIYNKTGLITFHGPMPAKVLTKFSVQYLQKAIMQPDLILFENDQILSDDLIQTEHRITPINLGVNNGVATGTLIGGNLSVLVNLLGSNYLAHNPEYWQNKILFVEEVNEEIFRIDRMLSQLHKANIFSNIRGFIFGLATDCKRGSMGCVSLEETLYKYFKDLNIPVFSGAMFGHGSRVFTLPIGGSAEMNAKDGTVKMLEMAIK